MAKLAPMIAPYYLVEEPLRSGTQSGAVPQFRVTPAMATGKVAAAVSVPVVYIHLIEPNSSRDQLVGDFGSEQYYVPLSAIGFDCLRLNNFISSQPETNPTVVILGDSHGAHLFLGLAEQPPRKNVAWLPDCAGIYHTEETPPQRVDNLLSVTKSTP